MEEVIKLIIERTGLNTFLSVPAPDIFHKDAFLHDENDTPIDCNIYHLKYGYLGFKTYSNDIVAASFNTRHSYMDYDTGERIYAPYYLQMLCSGDGINFTNKDCKKVIKVDFVQTYQKRLAENEQDFELIYQREFESKKLSDTPEIRTVFCKELINHVQELIQLHEKNSSYKEGRDIKVFALAGEFIKYLKCKIIPQQIEKHSASHREMILAHNFKVKAGIETEKTPAQWKEERGEKARQAFYTTLSQSENYKEPSLKELSKVIELLIDFPTAQKMAINKHAQL